MVDPNPQRAAASAAFSVVLGFAFLASACTSSTSSGSSSAPVTAGAPSTATAYGVTVGIGTGAIRPLPGELRDVRGLLRGVTQPHEGRLQRLLQLAGSSVRREHRRDTHTQDHSPGTRCPRRAMVRRRLACWCINNETTRPSTWETSSCGTPEQVSERRSRTSIRRWSGIWWFTFPSFAPGNLSILFQLPRGHRRNPTFDLWSVPVTGGRETLIRRNAGWGGYSPTAAGSPTSHRSAAKTSPAERSGSQTSTEGQPKPWSATDDLRWLRWSPDGTQVAYSDDGSAIYVVNAATGLKRKVARRLATPNGSTTTP